MNKLENAIMEATNLVDGIWSRFTGYQMHSNTFKEWRTQKEAYLMDVFGEELILKKEIEINQSFDEIRGEIYSYKEKLMKFIVDEDWLKDYSKENCYAKYRIASMLDVHSLYDNRIDGAYEIGGKKFSKGEKITKALKKLISNPVTVSKLQIEYSQIVNQKKTRGTLCLSIHPLDFLTMSHTSSWGSCYDVFNDGEYRAGALEFMCSKNTICAYLYTQETEVGRTGYDWNDKKWRTIVSVNPEEYLMTGKSYPYRSEELTSMVYEWVRELMVDSNFPSFKEARPLDEMEKVYVEVEYGYNDANHADEYFMFGKEASCDHTTICVDYGVVPCPKCGDDTDFDSEMIECHDCDDSFYCENCEERVSSGSDSYIVQNGSGGEITVCYSCYDYSCRECANCREDHILDNMTQDEDGECYCPDCANEVLVCCSECEDWVLRENTKEYKDANYCQHCYREAVRRDKESEEA